MTDLQVECYSGHTYAQEPRAFVWQGRRLPGGPHRAAVARTRRPGLLRAGPVDIP